MNKIAKNLKNLKGGTNIKYKRSKEPGRDTPLSSTSERTGETEERETNMEDQSEGSGDGPANTQLRRRQGDMSKYNANLADDGSVFDANDDDFKVFEQGRDFEPVYIPHVYTKQERETLASFESQDYLPGHSRVYRHWVKKQMISRLQLDRWVMMGMIGFVVGVIGFLLHQIIEQISDLKWDKAGEMLKKGDLFTAFLFVMGYGVAFILFSASIVIFWRPSAGGSGIPEVTGFLNGTHIRHIFNLQTMIVKLLSCAAAVGCGMPVGPEGPMIHLGGLVGTGLSQMKSKIFGIDLHCFERFRNSEDRRNFVSAGAAAGVASAFGAPVGGLLFSMEEVSSFWSTTLSWQTFFCCMISTFTTDLLQSAFEKFEYTGQFGQFKTGRYILFHVIRGVDVNIMMFIPTILLGALGGTMGALFTLLNLKITRLRRRVLARMSAQWQRNMMNLLEPPLVMVVVSVLTIYLPSLLPCNPYTCIKGNDTKLSEGCLKDSTNDHHIIINPIVDSTCNHSGGAELIDTTWYTNDTYSDLAPLLFGTTESAVHNLFARATHGTYSYLSLTIALLYYFIMVCWACGTSVSSGILVPMLCIGALYGRIVGLCMTTLFGVHMEEDSYWRWMDPGAFALIGAASFMGGVTRLTLTVTVIMIELTNDVQVLLPVMLSVMMAKWVGDFFTHPVFHALMEMKCIPFLDPEPSVSVMGKNAQLELFCVGDVMANNVHTVKEVDSVPRLAELILNTTHGGYPVTRMSEGRTVFVGLITRLELIVLLLKDSLFTSEDESVILNRSEHEVQWVEYEELLIDQITNPEEKTHLLNQYCDEGEYENKLLDLRYYMNESALCIPLRFSLQRAYLVFRTLGLRHLTVVNDHNEVVGIVTRKDLMGFSMVEQLSAAMEQHMQRQDQGQEMTSVSSETSPSSNTGSSDEGLRPGESQVDVGASDDS